MSRLHRLAIALSLAAACKSDPVRAPTAPPTQSSVAALSAAPRRPEPAGAKIEAYRISLGEASTKDKRRVIALRAFEKGGVSFALVTAPVDLKTEIIRREDLEITSATWESLAKSFPQSPYLRALSDANQHASALQDAGITHVLPEEHGVVLTVDLCPSRHPLDAVLFDRVISTFTPEEHPVPVAIAITGTWMAAHPTELARLLDLSRAGKLDITWINHSYHHRYDPKLPLTQNFLLEKGTQIEDEVLKNEVAMIETGITPSVLFRFPGLISEEKIVHTIVGYGLIPIGSDAWLAKKERAHSGDIVLVHGNGNEPKGISAFLTLLATEKKDVKKHQFLLLDIREGIEEEESK